MELIRRTKIIHINSLNCLISLIQIILMMILLNFILLTTIFNQ